MAPRLSHAKLNDIWKSGYCRVTVEFARKQTDDSPDGSLKRVEFLRDHIQSCLDCACATILKSKEQEVAKKMGPRAHAAFLMGQDITRMPGYHATLVLEALEDLAAHGVMTDSFRAWMARAAKRKAYRIPGR